MYWGRLYALGNRLYRIIKKVLRRHTVQPMRFGLPAGCPWKPDWLARQGKPPLQRYGSRRYFLVLSLVLALVPGVAYAATGSLSYDDMAVVWGPNYVSPRAGSGVIANGVLVCANSRYNAALVTLGISVTDSRLTHDVKAKLSNESTGGAFYTFSQLFDAYKQSDGLHYPPWGGLDNRMVDEYAYLIGDEWLYFAAYTDAQKASALEDLNAILDGGDIGGGGSGGAGFGNSYKMTPFDASLYQELNPVTFYNTVVYQLGSTKYYNLVKSNGDVRTTDIASSYFIRFGDTLVNKINALDSDYSNMLIVHYNRGGSFGISLYLYDDSATVTPLYQNGHLYAFQLDGNFTTINVSSKRVSTWPNTIYDLSSVFTYDVTTQNFYSTSYSGWVVTTYCTSYYLSSENPVIPPTQWPETPEPSTPVAPVVPAPGNVQITISSRPTFNYVWVQQTNTTMTTTTYDNSQELRSIYDELVAFHLDGITSYNTMIDCLNNVSDGIFSLGTDMDNQFSWLFDNLHAVIDGNFHALKEYLRQLFEWLASQMDFTVTGGGYNDATVVSWLKRIWSRLGSGFNTRPNDPVANPGESVDWLGQFFDTLLGGLGDVVSSLAADVLGLVDDVHDKFPFSIPWDALAALTALAAVPTTPHFTFDYVIAGAHVVYDIDLAPYNDLASVLRSAIIFFWSFCLLMKTTWLLDILGGATNMIGNFAVQALGG